MYLIKLTFNIYLNRVGVSRRSDASEGARVVFASVKDAQTVLKLGVPARVTAPPFRVFPVSYGFI